MSQTPRQSLETLARLIEGMPYAKWIGMQIEEKGNALLFCLPFQKGHIGNTLVPALHGGLISGFLEAAAVLYVMWACKMHVFPRIVDWSIDYLRSGKPQDVWAQCDIVRQGKRVANIGIRAWQDDYTAPIAAARAHFLLVS